MDIKNVNITDRKDLNTSNKVLIFFVICFISFVLGSIGVRARYIYFFISLLNLFCVLFFTKKYIIKIDLFRIYWLITYLVVVIFIIAPNARHDNEVISYFLFITIVTMSLMIAMTDENEIVKVFKIIRVAALIAAIYISFFRVFSGLYYTYILPHLSSYNQAEGSYLNLQYGYGAALGNSYTFGDYLIMLGIAELLASDISENNKKLTNKILIMVCFLGVLLEGRKGELVCSIIAISIIVLLSKDRVKVKISIKTFIMSVFLVLLFLILIPKMADSGLLKRFTLMFSRISELRSGQYIDFTSGRLKLWSIAYDLFKENPFLGIGWGRFGNYATGHYSNQIGSISCVHNSLLQLLCETGIIGTFLIVFPIIIIIIKYYNNMIQLKKAYYKDSFAYKCAVFTFTMTLFFLILSFIDPVFSNHFFWCAYSIIMIIGSNVNLKNER